MLKKIISTIVCIISLNAWSTPTPKQELIKLLEGFRDLEADFTQKTYDADQNMVQSSKGTMALIKPNKFSWNSNGDNKFLLVVDGKKIWNYDIDLEQVIVKQLKDVEMQKFTPLKMLLMGTESLQEFNVTKDSNQCFALQINPDIDSYVDKLTLCFTDAKINKLNFYDDLGQETVINFTQVKIDQKPNNKIFIFSIPKNVDVIKE